MQQILLIAVGGSLGAVARYGLSAYTLGTVNDIFPWGTLIVNVTGSFVIGAFIEMCEAVVIPSDWRSFVTIGFIGAYTTFSTYTLETVNLLREGEVRVAAINVIASNVAGILFVVMGFYSARFLLKLFS